MTCNTFVYKDNIYTKEELLELLKKEKISNTPYFNLSTPIAELKGNFGLQPGESIEEYLNREQPDLIFRVKEINPNLNITIDETLPTQYHRGTNTVNISFTHLASLIDQFGIPPIEFFQYVIEHELTHAIQVPALLQDQNLADTLTKMLDRVRKIHESQAFIDGKRGGETLNGVPIALKDIYEFAAEATTNPFFIEYLKQIKNKEVSFFDRIINFFRKLLGLSPINQESVYSYITEILNTKEFVYQNIANLTQTNPFINSFLPAQGVWDTFNLNVYEGLKQEKDKFEGIFDDIFTSLFTLNRSLNNDIHYNQKRIISTLIEDYEENPQDLDRIRHGLKVISTLWTITENIQKGLKQIEKEPFSPSLSSSELDKEVSERLVKLQSYVLETNSFEDIIPLINTLINAINQVPTPNDTLTAFKNNLNTIANIKQLVQLKYVQLARPLLVQLLSVEESYIPALLEIKNQIELLKQKRDIETHATRKKYYEDRIQQLENNIKKFPVKENFSKLFKGEINDVTFTDLNMVSMHLNSNFAIQQLAKLLQDKDIALTNAQLEVSNIIENLYNNFTSATGKNQKDFVDKATQKEEIAIGVEEDDKGVLKFKYKETRVWKVDFTPGYIKTFTEFDKGIQYYRMKMRENPDKYTKIYEDYYQTYTNWLQENVQTMYEDTYYEQFRILHEKIKKDDGTLTTLAKERNNLYLRLNHIEEEKMLPGLSSDRLDQLERDYDEVYAEIKQLLNPYDAITHEKKTGFELRLHEQALLYKQSRDKVIDYELTDKGRKRYEEDEKNITDRYNSTITDLNLKIQEQEELYKNGKISESKYNKAKEYLEEEITTLKSALETELRKLYQIGPSEEFYKKQKELSEKADEILQGIMTNEELNKYVKSSGAIESFQTMKNITRAYRDNDYIINGFIVPENTAKKVKEIEENIEAAKKTEQKLQNLKNLSESDYNRFKELTKKGSNRTPTEDNDFYALRDELIERQKLYKKYKDEINKYKEVLKELYSLSEAANSEYYYQKVEEEINKEKQKVLKELNSKSITELEDALEKEGFTFENNSIRDPLGNLMNDIIEAKEEAAYRIAKLNFKNSDWYKENHLERTFYTKGGGTKTESVPIYIWRTTYPKNVMDIVRNIHPKYKTPVITAKKTANHRNVFFKLGNPKKTSKFYVKDSLSQSYKDLRDGLRQVQERIEVDSGMDNSQRLFDVLPGVPKHPHELTKEFISKGINTEFFKNLKNNLWKVSSEDEQLEQEGSQTISYFENRVVPFRFNRVMDVEKQSSDVLFSVIKYFAANTNAYNMATLQPIFEAMLASLEGVEMADNTNVAVKQSFRTFKTWAANKVGGNNRGFENNQSRLYKNVEHLLKTYIYGQTKSNGKIGNVDVHKVTSKIKNVMSHSIFAFNWTSPAKTLIAGEIFMLLNARQGKNFYTHTDAVIGMGKVTRQLWDLMDDYYHKKFGNKSHIGQAMEYFQVVNGGGHDAFGRYTSFNLASEAMTGVSLPKHLSEISLQMGAFNALSIANKVKLADGTKVPFHEAFETKDNKFQLKQKVTKLDDTPITQEDINKFIYKVKLTNLYINGAFRADEKSLVEKNPLGSLLFYLNGFVVPGIIFRYKNDWYSYMTDDIQRGHIREAMRFAQNLIKYKGQVQFLWGELTTDERNRVLRFVYELSAATIGLIAVALLGGGDTKDENKDKSTVHQMMLVLTMAAASELQTFIPLPYLGGDELIRKLENPFAVTRQIKNMYKLILNLLELTMYPFDGESGVYKHNTGIDDGFHDKGDPKFIPNLLKLLGVKPNEWHMLDKIQSTKQVQTIR